MNRKAAIALVGMMVLAMPILPCANANDVAAPQVTITYLANEGIMISLADKVVLIDSLFRKGVSGYDRHDPAVLEEIETARPPYDGVGLILVTHFHADHFHAGSVARHLEHNENAKLVTSAQVAQEVRKAAVDDAKGIAARIHSRTPDVKSMETDESAGIRVDVLGLSHGGGRFENVRNMGYVVHLGGKRILHVGDAQLNQDCFEPLAEFAKGVDVACLPHWMIEHPKGVGLVRDVLQPKHLVVFHIMPRDAARVSELVGKSFPGATCFTRRMAKLIV